MHGGLEGLTAGRLLAGAVLVGTLLSACGGDDDPAPASGTGTAEQAEGACKTAMVDVLSAAYEQAEGAEDFDEAFEAAAGQLPSECRLLDASVLQRLVDAAKDEAIAATS